MEEKRDNLENSKKINQLSRDNTLQVEFSKVREFTNEVYREISKKVKSFNDKKKQDELQKIEESRRIEAERIAEEVRKADEIRKAEEAAKKAIEDAKLAEEAAKKQAEEAKLAEEAAKKQAEEAKIAEEAAKKALDEAKKAEEKKQEVAEEKPIVKEEVKSEEKPQEPKVEAKAEVKVENKDNKKEEKKFEKKPESKAEVKEEKPQEPQKPVIIKTDNPNIVIINGKRVFVPNARKEVNNNNNSNNNNYNNNNQNRNNNRPNNGERKPFDRNNKPGFNKQNNQNGQRPQGQNGQQGQRDNKAFSLNAPTFVPKDNNQKTKKKVAEKSYDDKKVVNKKSLIKGQSVLDDYNEDMTGVRKIRKVKEKKVEVKEKVKIEKAVITKEIIPIKELSELIGVQAVEITKILFKEGIMKTINDTIDYDTAGFIAAGLGVELELKLNKTAEEILTENNEIEDEALLEKRPPVVTVMGHVDHGKTSLLDYIRHTSVTAGEAGGITQHIGAYTVNLNGEKITFLDTPGHAAFTAMRARGAQLTDIAIIVVAADDGIMPQTIEAIHHAKAANVSIIIAANKIDKPTIDLERVKKELADQEVLIEDWGGDVPFIPVSAKTGAGIDSLLETILLTAEMKELKANPNKMAKGAIVEAKLDKGKGPVATVLVQSGTLKVGDYLVAGTTTGKVRAMIDDKGKNVQKAGPSTPVSVLGLAEVPNAGDSIFAVEEAKMSTLVAEERRNKEKEEMIKNQQKVSLDELFSKVSTGDLKNLNIIVKADVQGSVEAVKQSLSELSNEEVKVNVIHAQVGAISETDVSLADSSNSIIIGFNVRPDSKAKDLAERSKVDIKLYRIIYEAIEDIKAALNGMLNPKYEDKYQGKAEVRETFKISNVGTVAGCYVVDGKILRSGKLRIYRNDIMICEGNVLQLKRFKDDVKEVAQGFECGMSIEKFDDIKIGDFIECYTTEKVN